MREVAAFEKVATLLFIREIGALCSHTQNSAAVQGSMNTNKGYTGQYADPLTGFDYYNARYYDPVCGVFLSADPVEGNMQGMNPYAYVDGNPETNTDPTGEMYAPPPGSGGDGGSGGGGTQSHSSPPPSCNWWCWAQQQWNHYVAPVVNHFVAPAEHFAQQMEEQVLRTVHRGLTLWHVVGVIVFGVVIYGLWRFTASSPPAGWTRPEWGELIHNEGVTHQWYTRNGNGPRSVTTHVMSKHVGMDPLSLLKRTMEEGNSSTSYYTMDDAQWAVDYALSTMTAREKQKLENMMKNPRTAGTLVLNRTTSRAVGYGFKYDNGTITLEYDITSFQVTIRVDPNTGVPFIVTSYPTA